MTPKACSANVIMPLSSGQQNILALEKTFPGTPINNICASLVFSGRVRPEHLVTAIKETVAKDSTLSLRISEEDGKAVQYLSKEGEPAIRLLDFSFTGKAGFLDWAEDESRRPFFMPDRPLYGFAVCNCGKNCTGLFVRLHHLISDGYSTGDLLTGIAGRVLALLNSDSYEEEERFDYSDFIQWERDYATSPAYERDRRFWEETLAMETDAAALSSRTAAGASDSRRLHMSLDGSFTELINGYCAEKRISPFVLIYSAFAEYMRRAGAGEYISVGVPVVNRSTYAQKKTTGMFVSTLPFVCKIDDGQSFDSFEEDINCRWTDVMRHQRFPFSEMKKLRNEGATSFRTMISFQPDLKVESTDPEVKIYGKWHCSGTQAEQLCIHIIGDGKGYSVDYDFLIDELSEEDIIRLHGCICRFIENGVKAPDTPACDLDIVGGDERKFISEKMTGKQVKIPEKTPYGYIYDSCDSSFAVICGGRAITYKELKAQAEKLASRIGQKQLCAILLEPGTEIFTAIAAAMYAGSAWLTIAPGLPSKRVQSMLESSGADCVITNGKLSEAIELPPCCTAVDISAEAPAKSAARKKQSPEDTAYVIYTSGSTGKPKGVEISVRSLCNLALAMKDVYPDLPILSVCNPGFDAFILESAAALMNGRTVVMTTSEQRENPEELASLLEKYRVGFISTTPSRLGALLGNESFRRAASVLKCIVCGGEAFRPELVRKIRANTEAKIYNQYGPSEAAVAVSMAEVDEYGEITAGGPLQNCRLYVLDRNLKMLPAGMPGELYIGGVCVGKGYKNAPELTAGAFIESPFESGERLYKTGDIACVNGDGNLVIAGRRDGQIKIRGLRVETDEIVSRIGAYPGVIRAAAKVAEISGQKVIIGYYTAEKEIPEQQIMLFCAKFLPEYMIPSRILKIDEIPLTQNGKADLRSLPLPEDRGCNGTPANIRQQQLLKIFREVLEREDIYADSNYFLCGGNSLNAMETLRRIHGLYGITLPVSAMYACRTVMGLDAYISENTGIAADEITKNPQVDTGSYPLTSTQTGIYLSSAMDKSGRAYQMPCILELQKQPDIQRLSDAFAMLAADEPLMRACFAIEGNELRMNVSAEAEQLFRVSSGSTLDEDISAITVPFDLAQAPLFRAVLHCGDGKNYLLLNIHHIIADGLTVPVLLERLGNFYDNGSAAEHLSFTDLVNYYGEKGGETREEDLNYWKNLLQGCPDYSEIPGDYTRPAFNDFKGGSIEYTLDEAASKAADSLCEKFEITPYVLFTGAIGLYFTKLSGAAETVIGTPVHGRNLAGTENIAGPLMKVMPVRLKPEGSIADYFAAIRENSAAAADHTGCSAGEIAGSLGIAPVPGRNPLYSILFQTRPVDTERMNIGSLPAVYRPLPMNISKLDLNIEAAKEKGTYRLYLEYATSVFGENTVRLFAAGIADTVRRLDGLYADSDINEALAPSPEALELINSTYPVRDVPDRGRLQEIICANCRKFGYKNAIIWHGTYTTFAELDRESARVAGLLRDAGVKKGDKVGLVMSRTPLMFACLLAILRKGAAYVPFLKNYPAERAEYMMHTASVNVILCDGEAKEIFENSIAGVRMIDASAECEPDSDIAAVSGDDPIYVLFTSGSTGKPKGVQLPHRALSNLSEEMGRLWKGQHGPVLCSTNMTFDIFGTESLIALANGYTVLLADDSQMVMARDLGDLIKKHNPGIAQFTPSKLAMCLRNRHFAQCIGGLGFTILVGENVPPSLVSDFKSYCSGKLVNMYGPTEAAVYVTAGELEAGRQVTIGRALGNCRLYVLDEKLKHAVPGCRGELWLAGVCLADGYIGRPDLTEKVFLPDPFFEGQRMYRTGDIARLRGDGEFECFGRIDNQVKINGNRVEIGEIDEALKAAGAAAAVTVVKKNPDGSSVLEAVVTPQDADIDRIYGTIRSKLPPHMIPHKILAIGAIPYNASGKADVPLIKKLLEGKAEIKLSAGNENSAAEKPDENCASDTLSKLLRVWSDVLGIQDPKPDVSFFAQNGSSLSALSALSDYSNLGIHMDLDMFYANPTAQEQARLIDGSGEKAAEEKEISDRFRHDVPAFRTDTPKKQEGLILFTGATGYLGSHILKELLERDPSIGGRIVCLTRKEGYTRLHSVLDGYFGDGFSDASGVSCIGNTDICSPHLGLDTETYLNLKENVSLIINSAADVRHYASDDSIFRTNTLGTANAAAFALEAGAELIHISTASVSGNYVPGHGNEHFVFDESMLDIGQERDNQYIKSKLAAENEIFTAVEKGLRARIFRIGRLCGRYSDGVFQNNPDTNAFMLTVRGMQKVGAIPESMANLPVELSPVDICAKAVVTLMDAEKTVLHTLQPKPIALKYLLPELGSNIKICSDGEFEKILAEAVKRDSAGISYFVDFRNSLLAGRLNVMLDCKKTHKMLSEKSFEWPSGLGKSLAGFRSERGG